MPVARRQSGVFSRAQAVASGLSERQVDGRLAAGTWLRLLPAVYALPGLPLTWTSWAWAAVLSAGPGTVLVAGSAATLWRWQPERWPVTVAVAPNRRVRWPTARLKPLRLAVDARDAVVVDGLPTTGRLRTAVDVAHLLPVGQAQPLLDRALVLGAVELGPLAAAVSRSRRTGARQAKVLLRSAADHAASEAERLAHRVLRQAGIRGWTANHVVRLAATTVVVDIAFVGAKVAVEINGWAFHATPDRRARDEARSAALQLDGWVVLSFSWWDLTQRPEYVVRTVRTALERRMVA